MKPKYSQNWRDYILVSIMVGGILGMCLFQFLVSGFEAIIPGFIIGAIICSPFILLIGYPTLMFAQKFDDWKKWAIVALVGFFSSNGALLLIGFLASRLFADIEGMD